jgi:hypothetical protein
MGANGRECGLDVRDTVVLDWEGLSLRRITDSGESAYGGKCTNPNTWIRTSPPAALISSARVLRWFGSLAIRAMRYPDFANNRL